MLTQVRLKQLLNYDPDTGDFRWKVSGNGRNVGGVAGSRTAAPNDRFYTSISVDSVAYGAHRLAVLYMTGEWPAHVVDHEDNDGENNCWENLKCVTQSENLTSLNIPGRGKSGVRGVYWNEKAQRWSVSFMVKGQKIYLGLFDTVPEAEAAKIASKKGEPLPPPTRYRYQRGPTSPTPTPKAAVPTIREFLRSK